MNERRWAALMGWAVCVSVFVPPPPGSPRARRRGGLSVVISVYFPFALHELMSEPNRAW